jgi:hypothetical protein
MPMQEQKLCSYIEQAMSARREHWVVAATNRYFLALGVILSNMDATFSKMGCQYIVTYYASATCAARAQ